MVTQSAGEEIDLHVDWPSDIPLPTPEEVEQAIAAAEEKIADALEQLQAKLPHTDPEMQSALIVI